MQPFKSGESLLELRTNILTGGGLACHSLDCVRNLVGSIFRCIAYRVSSSLIAHSLSVSHQQVVLRSSLEYFALHRMVLISDHNWCFHQSYLV